MSKIINVEFYRIVPATKAKIHTHYSNFTMLNFTESGMVKELEKKNKGYGIELIKYKLLN